MPLAEDIVVYLDARYADDDLGDRSGVPPMPSEMVEWAYRLFLDREPEDPANVDEVRHAVTTTAQLRRVFTASPEFRQKADVVAEESIRWEPLRRRVDVDMAPAELERALVEVRRDWTRLGSTEPFWSVIPHDRFRAARIDAHLDEFLLSGRRELDDQLGALARLGSVLSGGATVLEYGCGVGRVTRWLAERAQRVYAYDVSATHLEVARRLLPPEPADHVDWRHVTTLAHLAELPRVDLVYCFLVLQHNPPPLIATTILSLLGSLKPGGIALMQVPTYRRGYVFDKNAYLAQLGPGGPAEAEREMHLLPQGIVLRLAQQAGCMVEEVRDDRASGPGFVSNTFVVRRPL